MLCDFISIFLSTALTCTLPTIANGNVGYTVLNVGAEVSISCNSGYVLSTREKNFNQSCIQNSTDDTQAFWDPVFDGQCEGIWDMIVSIYVKIRQGVKET